MDIAQLISDNRERAAQFSILQRLYSAFTLLKYVHAMRWKGDSYAAHAATLRYERLAASVDGWRMSPAIARINSDLVAAIKKRVGRNSLAAAYAVGPEASRYREEFRSYGWEHQVRLRYPRENDEPGRQGDLLILKPHVGEREKGVLLLQYNDAFDKFVSLYDLDRVAERYRIVLEPSTWGYREPAILFFLNAPTDVIVQAQSAPDFQYIQSLAANLVPLRMGAGDWVDDERFQAVPAGGKIYDIVMVASWQRIKRHALLFEAVKKSGDTVRKIALIGYPSSGRTAKDIVHEAEQFGVGAKIELFENISRDEVSRIIGQSRIGVMLTVREGANRGLYECFFSGVPAVISTRNIGVNREHINRHTGLVAGDDELAGKIAALLNGIHSYSPREWALGATGYKISTRRLNDCLRNCAARDGEEWTQDIYAKKNDTNARYVLDRDRMAADRAMAHLRGFLRN